MRTLLLLLIVVACSPAWASQPLDKSVLNGLPNLSFHEPNFVASGRIEADDIATLVAAGIEVVIDLSDDEETPEFDESADVAAAGMRYQNLPIDGAAGLTEANVEKLDRMMTAAGDSPTLIHCGSSNRVGALIALRAATLQGQSVETAIEIGKAWGLKGLEPAVREQLAARGSVEATRQEVESPALQYPRIATFGGVYAMPASVPMPAANREHRLVIDATGGADTPASIDRRVEAAARAVNLYALAGVSPKKLKVAVVLHGKSTSSVLTDASYQEHFGMPNPNAALIKTLHEAGVEFFLCGQAMTHRGYVSGDVRDDVRIALSAMTALTDLQSSDYALIP